MHPSLGYSHGSKCMAGGVPFRRPRQGSCWRCAPGPRSCSNACFWGNSWRCGHSPRICSRYHAHHGFLQPVGTRVRCGQPLHSCNKYGRLKPYQGSPWQGGLVRCSCNRTCCPSRGNLSVRGQACHSCSMSLKQSLHRSPWGNP